MRVVVVDDEADLRRLLEIDLQLEGIDVVALAGAVEPEMLSPRYWAGIDALVVDAMMPGTPGEDLVAYVRAAAPHVRTVMLTAASASAARSGAHAVLLKPYVVEELLEAIRG